MRRPELIRVDQVSVSYAIQGQGRKTVLNGVDLSIYEGDFISVAGQTGCGKSTLLRLILGSERPESGTLTLQGAPITHPDRHRGYVPQKYSLFPDKTVLDNIAFGPSGEATGWLSWAKPSYWSHRRAIRDEAMHYLRSMGLQEADASKYPDQLSGGMQQRVAIAQALIMKPKVLLMDEAFSALDPGTRTDMQRLIRRVWRDTGTTVLFVTHNIAEAIYLGSRVVVLGKPSQAQGSRVVLDLEIPDSCRQANGYPRPDEISHLSRSIEDAALGGRFEQELAEFGG